MTAPGDLESLRELAAADVLKQGRRAATLSRTGAGVEFRYLDEWTGPPVSSTLPVSTTPVLTPGGGVPAYFGGLLPEGRRLGALRRAVKTSADDELSLLLAIGADAIGDVQVVAAGATPAEVPARVVLDGRDDIHFREILDELGIQAQRVGLPGVQDKTSAAMINLPVTRAGDRFILKLNPIGAFPHHVENESFFLDAAASSGFLVPPHELIRDVDGEPGLLVRRFDRTTVDGGMHQLAVEDGCQAMGLPPADKYRLAAEQAFAALAALCDAPTVAARELIRQLSFAYLTGNGDAHAKNFSVVQGLDGEWRVAPAYDLASSYVYGDRTMAMAVGHRRGPELSTADFVGLGAGLGVPEPAVRRALLDIAGRADHWIDDLIDLPFDAGQVRTLRRVILHRRDLLVR
jgi:serine/threonine-protein kinase HipA